MECCVNKKAKWKVIIISSVIICVLYFLLQSINQYQNLINKVLFDLPRKPNKELMTLEELEIYNTYRSLIIKGDENIVKDINDMFEIDKNNIFLKVYTTKSSYEQNEDVIVSCEITNVGEEAIHIFPLFITRLSNAYTFNQNIKIDYELTFSLTNQTHLKILKPGDIYQSDFVVRDKTLGKHVIAVSLATPKIINLEKRILSIDSQVIDLVETSYEVTDN